MPLEGILGSTIAFVLGTVGYLHKRATSRIDGLRLKLDRQQRAVDSKLDRGNVKEVVEDKLAPIMVTLQEIKKDLDEIGRDVKKITHKG